MNRAGATVPVQSIKACVVYDPATGAIHHEHRVLTLAGGREPTESEIAEAALKGLANRRRPPKGEFQVLHVNPAAMESGKRYRVDVKAKALVTD
ncbi:MAG: hypothetical protein WCB99_11725 [Candidatus Cybelea sp.]|jgi:hypothetical protein